MLQHLPHALADNHPGQRLIRRGQALGNGDQVRLHFVVLRTEVHAQPAETADHFIGNQQDVVLIEHLADFSPVAFWRWHDTAGAQYWFTDHRGNGIRTFGENHFFEFLCAVNRELLLAHRVIFATVVDRRNGVFDALQRQVEVGVEHRQAGHRTGCNARPVIATVTRDHLLLLFAAKDIVVVPNQLELGLVGIRAGHAVIDFAHALACELDDALRQLRHAFGRVANIGVVVRELLGLLVNGFGHFGAAIANVYAIQAGKAVDEFVAQRVLNADALRAGNDPRRAFAVGVLLEMSRRVEHVLAVDLDNFLGVEGHDDVLCR